MTADAWDFTIRLNLHSVFLCARAAARLMMHQGSGAIVCMSAKYRAALGTAYGAGLRVSEVAANFPRGTKSYLFAPLNVPPYPHSLYGCSLRRISVLRSRGSAPDGVWAAPQPCLLHRSMVRARGMLHTQHQLAVSMNFGPLVLTNIGPPSGV